MKKMNGLDCRCQYKVFRCRSEALYSLMVGAQIVSSPFLKSFAYIAGGLTQFFFIIRKIHLKMANAKA